MRTSTRTIARAAAAVVAAGLAIGATLGFGNPAGADPKQFSALIAMGSDTTQDILNALAGEANGNLYTPVRSTPASGNKQVVSWDAVGSTCITPKAPGATINRPNGSTAGRKALSRAIDGTGWGTTACGAGPKSVAGLVQFARSSAGPSGPGTQLTYIPFGRDAMSFAYYKSNGGPVTALTRAQLITIYSSAGPHIIGGVEIVPCGIQTNSGTYQFWQTAHGGSNEPAATAACEAAGTPGRLQESDAAGLKAKGDSSALAGKQVIVGFSAANFISQSNLKAASQLAPGVDLGSISDNGSGTNLGIPYSGTAPNLVPRATFYDDTTFGRTVYNVFDTARVTGLGNNDYKSLFVGGTSAVCAAAAQTTVNAFGFLSVPDCGSTTLQGPLIAGAS